MDLPETPRLEPLHFALVFAVGRKAVARVKVAASCEVGRTLGVSQSGTQCKDSMKIITTAHCN